MSQALSEIWLIRHAQSTANALPEGEMIVGGHSLGLKLTEKGERQAKLLGERLLRLKNKGLRPNRILTSTADRAHSTALIAIRSMLEKEDIRYCYSLDPRLIERGMGDWEQKRHTEVYTPENLLQLSNMTPDWKAPNGESFREVGERMYKVIHEINELQRFGENALVFSHGIAIRCLLGKLGFMPWDIVWKSPTENTSITRIAWHPTRGWIPIGFNDCSHLE